MNYRSNSVVFSPHKKKIITAEGGKLITFKCLFATFFFFFEKQLFCLMHGIVGYYHNISWILFITCAIVFVYIQCMWLSKYMRKFRSPNKCENVILWRYEDGMESFWNGCKNGVFLLEASPFLLVHIWLSTIVDNSLD